MASFRYQYREQGEPFTFGSVKSDIINLGFIPYKDKAWIAKKIAHEAEKSGRVFLSFEKAKKGRKS